MRNKLIAAARPIFALIAASALSGMAGGTALAGSITKQLDFGMAPPPGGRCRADEACRPWGEELPSWRKELHPVIPVRTVRIMLPAGHDFKYVKYEATDGAAMDYFPEIAGRQKVISLGYDTRPFVARYAGGVFPPKLIGEPRQVSFRGFNFVEVPVYPFQMTSPTTARYYNAIKLTVETEPVTRAPLGNLLRPNLARDYEDAIRGIDNDVVATRAQMGVASADDAPVGYLVIGKQAIIGDEASTVLRPLIDEKRARGINVRMATLESIGGGAGAATAAQIRDFIKGQYRNEGIDFVLLVGDKANLPWQRIRSGMGSNNGDPVPSDQFYACLDGTFTGSTSDYDWQCEVAVGRVGVRTSDQLQAWVAKHMALVDAAKAGRTKGAMSYGEELDRSTLGGWILDHLVTGRNVAPLSAGFPQSTQFTKLYDSFSQQVGATQFLETMAGGDFHVVNHLGHANSDYALRMNASRIPEFKSRPAFFYSQGCYPNNPDIDNWTVQAVRLPEFGPAAMISNTRYGWYEPGRDGEGTSAVLHRTFWSKRFKDGVKALGFMNHQAKAAVLSVDRSNVMVYTALESNLIGDPELDLMIGE
jgi:hypothetical protein